MAVFDNLNKTTSSGVAAGVQDYYNAKIQKVLKETLVHSRDAQKVPLPEHNGKFVRFRKPTKLNPITTPLSEGVTPAGQTITLTDFRAMVKPYGGHIELTDEINFYLLDNMQMMAADLLAEQARESLDAILRIAFNAGTNVYYTGGKTVRSGLSATEKLDGATLKKVVRYMEKNSVPKFPDGFYHSIIGPETKYDLMDIGLLTDKAKYQRIGLNDDFSDRDWFIKPMADGRIHATDLYSSRITGALCVTVSGPIRDEMGDIVGVLGLDIRFEDLARAEA